MINKITNGDFLQIVKTISDESIDCIVTDPPYKLIAGGVSLKNGEAISDGTNCSNKWLKKNKTDIPVCMKNGTMFKHNKIKFSDWLPDAYRVLKDGSHCYVMVNDRNMQELLNEATKVKFKLLNILVWSKNNATPNKYYMKSAEFIVLFRKGFAKSINNMGTKTVLNINNIIGNKVHPSEKPIDLLKILIENSTKEGEIVLDCFSGSGNTCTTAKILKRRFIGIEIDSEYCTIANKRIKNTKE